VNQRWIMRAAKKISALTEAFFLERRNRADRKAFLRILNREGGEPPRSEDTIESSPKS